MGLTGTTKFNVIVAQDKSRDFIIVSEAVKATPKNNNTRFIKPGIYKKCIEVEFDMTFITLIRDDGSKTIIAFDRSNGSGFTTLTLTHSIQIKSSNIKKTLSGPLGPLFRVHHVIQKAPLYRATALWFSAPAELSVVNDFTTKPRPLTPSKCTSSSDKT